VCLGRAVRLSLATWTNRSAFPLPSFTRQLTLFRNNYSNILTQIAADCQSVSCLDCCNLIDCPHLVTMHSSARPPQRPGDVACRRGDRRTRCDLHPTSGTAGRTREVRRRSPFRPARTTPGLLPALTRPLFCARCGAQTVVSQRSDISVETVTTSQLYCDLSRSA